MGWVGVLIVREMEKRSCDDGEVVMVSEGGNVDTGPPNRHLGILGNPFWNRVRQKERGLRKIILGGEDFIKKRVLESCFGKLLAREGFPFFAGRWMVWRGRGRVTG